MIKTFRESLSLLATRRFGTFWFASLLSSIGTWAQQVAEPWLLLTLGASSFLIGLDSFAMNAPVWLLTLAGGALADRSDRRRVIALFQSIVPSIVRRDQIGAGLALNSTQFNLSRILGPSIAGVLMSSVGAMACLASRVCSAWRRASIVDV